MPVIPPKATAELTLSLYSTYNAAKRDYDDLVAYAERNRPPPVPELQRRTLASLARRFDPKVVLEARLSKLLLRIGDDFIDDAVSACVRLAGHRGARSVTGDDALFFYRRLHSGEPDAVARFYDETRSLLDSERWNRLNDAEDDNRYKWRHLYDERADVDVVTVEPGAATTVTKDAATAALTKGAPTATKHPNKAATATARISLKPERFGLPDIRDRYYFHIRDRLTTGRHYWPYRDYGHLLPAYDAPRQLRSMRRRLRIADAIRNKYSVLRRVRWRRKKVVEVADAETDALTEAEAATEK